MSALQSFAAELAPRGYRAVLEAEHGIILERVAQTGWDPSSRRAWYLERGKLPAVGSEIGGGALQPGDLALTAANLVFRVDPVMTQGPQPPEGAALQLQNGGVVRFGQNRWQSDRPVLPLAESPAISIGRGKYRVEPLRDEDGPYLRIRALTDAQWLVMVADVTGMPERAPFTALSTARCPGGTSCTFWLWTRDEVSDHAGPPGGEWHTFRLLRRVKDAARGDHLAIGLKNPRANDYFDVRELGVLRGFFP
jgi:hypothetical protein